MKICFLNAKKYIDCRLSEPKRNLNLHCYQLIFFLLKIESSFTNYHLHQTKKDFPYTFFFFKSDFNTFIFIDYTLINSIIFKISNTHYILLILYKLF